MTIRTKTTFRWLQQQIPTDLSSGTPMNSELAGPILDAINKGFAANTVTLVVSEEPDNDGYYDCSILRDWTDADQAQIWVDLNNEIRTPGEHGFTSCTVITE